MSEREVLELFFKANSNFLRKNKKLIDIAVSERCLCALLAHEINSLLEQTNCPYYCDVEYNRFGDSKKKIYERDITVDLIVHSRREQEIDNLLALEVKKIENTDKGSFVENRNRLVGLTTRKEYEYIVGIFYVIDSQNSKIIIEKYDKYSKDSINCNFTISELIDYEGVIEKFLK